MKTIEIKPYASDPAIESHTKSFLKALNSGGGDPMETMAPAEARKVLEGAQTSVEVDLSGVEVSEKSITQDGISVKIFITRPGGKTGTLPAFMFFHGGGWVLGDFPTHQRFVRDLVVYSGLVAVFVEYSRSPEVKYPVALNECYAATKWVAEHGAEIGVDGTNIAVAGNSAGGNLAAAVALTAANENGPKLKFQLLFWPVTDSDFNTKSYHKYAEDRFLTRNMMIWFWDNYIGTEERNEIYASPLKAELGNLKDLPPTLVQTAENDVLRSEGEAYARKMDEAGVNVTLVRIQGMIHDYGLLNPLAKVPAVQSALRYAAGELRKALI
ncbi:alpha/beta hydrolase fold domain-containing protein [Pedobacter sp. HMF7647]|uniref:Alpha/beta hydrolase fold domain-containing protein n=1 Tax=Hufsiella arboris TaxID=2695275 RepID=A0A7K1Y7Q2_9SPHI|nr:alpha/beta hydrolase [Hufsiella arboris]MXV50603.1 alpha/beta hydrolase fold domain-containing protein [Hufsiella arboris]